MIAVIDIINEYLWLGIIVLLVGCALYFTFITRGVQFSMMKDMLKITFCKEKKNDDDSSSQDLAQKKIKSIGSFQAFAVALSSRVGTGNLAGVASAIFVGGPGAVFWMWIMALLGSATAFVEATLAQLYKRKGETSFYGGPAYYMQTGLKRRWMGVLFAVLITLTFGIANQIVQSNTLIDALSNSFGWDKLIVGIILCAATLAIIFGGIHRISHFASLCVPFMAVGFILLSLYVFVTNITTIPSVLQLIFEEAFGVRQAAGGMVGAAIMQGVKRGLFSNEAGEGSAPNAAAIAHTSHPVKQGLIQAFGVFIDTLVICSCTAFIILISGLQNSGYDGIILTTHALESEIGPVGRYFITAAIFLFAYSTIIANYFYGETNIRFITRKKRYVQVFRVFTGAVIVIGAIVTLQTAWSIVDVCMGIMTAVNLTAIVLLSPKVVTLLKDYKRQKKEGKNPVFDKEIMPDIKDDLEGWE